MLGKLSKIKITNNINKFIVIYTTISNTLLIKITNNEFVLSLK